MLRRVLVAVALVVAATTALPADAHASNSCEGVLVIVDPHQLGGGVQQVCDSSGGGKTAATIFGESGFTLRYASGGMVCRVNNVPEQDPCTKNPPATAYWSLWWSDGRSGAWTFSSFAVGSLKVPAGGSVAWSWQGQQTKAQPSVAPSRTVAAAPTSKASPRPTGTETRKPRASSTNRPAPTPTSRQAATSSASPIATPSVAPSTGDTAVAEPTGGGTAAPTPSEVTTLATTTSTAQTPETGDQRTGAEPVADDGGLPGWIPPVVVVVLLGAAGGIAVARRAR